MNNANELPDLGFEPHIKGYSLDGFSYAVFDVDDVENTRLPADLTDANISIKLFTVNNKLAFEFKTGAELTGTTAPIVLEGTNIITVNDIPTFDLPVSIYTAIMSVEKDGIKKPYGVGKFPVVLTESEKYCCNG